ncbi:MAG: transcription termination/antitermination protein NusG [Nitrospirota bacterium]
MEKSWYVIHTYSGFENRVRTALEEKVKSLGIENRVGRVLVPTEEVVRIKGGKKQTLTKKFFPGYVLMEMCLDDQLQQMVKVTPKVTGFLGTGEEPSPLSQQEVELLLNQMDEGASPSNEKTQFESGDSVRITDGPFFGFNGVVGEIHLEQSKLKVMVSIFGRSTPVELNFLQVEKV